jgi:hypothetical protein
MKKISKIFLIFFLVTACGQGKIIETPNNAMKEFDEFISREKFSQNDNYFYSGLADEKLKQILTEKINLAAKDFKTLAEKGSATDKEYQAAIKNGLSRFSDVYLELDTEEEERICYYFEELMDIVGLESSGGLLNTFRYGFDPKNFIQS